MLLDFGQFQILYQKDSLSFDGYLVSYNLEKEVHQLLEKYLFKISSLDFWFGKYQINKDILSPYETYIIYRILREHANEEEIIFDLLTIIDSPDEKISSLGSLFKIEDPFPFLGEEIYFLINSYSVINNNLQIQISLKDFEENPVLEAAKEFGNRNFDLTERKWSNKVIRSWLDENPYDVLSFFPHVVEMFELLDYMRNLEKMKDLVLEILRRRNYLLLDTLPNHLRRISFLLVEDFQLIPDDLRRDSSFVRLWKHRHGR